MMGKVDSARSWRHNSIPFMLGMEMSVMTRSGCHSRADSEAGMSVIGGANFKAIAGKRSPQDPRDLRLIIHHQDAFLVGHRDSTAQEDC